MTFGLYNLVWHLLRPFIPLILRVRAWRGKEIASRLHDRFGQPQLDQKIKGAISILMNRTFYSLEYRTLKHKQKSEIKILK